MTDAVKLLPSLKDMILMISVVKMNYAKPEVNFIWYNGHLQLDGISEDDYWQESFATNYEGHLQRCLTYRRPHFWKYPRNAYVSD